MQPEIITVTVQKTTLASLADAVDLLEWTRSIPDVGCSVTATVDGGINVQLDGPNIPTAYARLGDAVIWDGTRFTVEHAQEEQQ